MDKIPSDERKNLIYICTSALTMLYSLNFNSGFKTPSKLPKASVNSTNSNKHRNTRNRAYKYLAAYTDSLDIGRLKSVFQVSALCSILFTEYAIKMISIGSSSDPITPKMAPENCIHSIIPG